ncbi:MAG: hypothetical protein ACREAE_04140 [Nitrosopumilaceae archaeon]
MIIHARTPERLKLGSNSGGYTIWDFWDNELKGNNKDKKRFLNEVGVLVFGNADNLDNTVLDELADPTIEKLAELIFG